MSFCSELCDFDMEQVKMVRRICKKHLLVVVVLFKHKKRDENTATKLLQFVQRVSTTAGMTDKLMNLSFFVVFCNDQMNCLAGKITTKTVAMSLFHKRTKQKSETN